MKNFLKFILYAGAVACCLAGLGVIYGVINGFRDAHSTGYWPGDWPYELALALIYTCIAFTPAIMFLTGLRTKTWHWVSVAIVEMIVIGVALYAILILIVATLSFRG